MLHAPEDIQVTSMSIPESRIAMEEDLETGNGFEAGVGGWFIPRPALCRNTTTCSCNSDRHGDRSIHTVSEWLSPTSSVPSSKSSTQSGTSGSLLLTAANLAALRLEQTQITPYNKEKQFDTVSLASSTHFTVVNGLPHRKYKPTTVDCCLTCQKHQLTVVVTTMCVLFLLGLIAAIYYIDMRARSTKLT
uniref:Uncharacterized protein n=1 Tax=Clastoptera arizonana TaxID=38151 RepID=A0A1B6CET1_9HEMI